jgi:hypothetical protein
LICTSQDAGIFPAITNEFCTGTFLSSVPVMIKTGLDIFDSSLQIPLQFVASQFSTALSCYYHLLHIFHIPEEYEKCLVGLNSILKGKMES